ncbi:MAG: L-aspartate oxidase [Caulobacteraceae bacterium]
MPDRLAFHGVLVVGAGLAGLSAALAAAPRPVLLLSLGPLGLGCASAWAQGGMAAALAADDDPALHAQDTIAAGAGLCDAEAVAILTREGPAAVRALAALGAPFDRLSDGTFVQSLEAAHGRARVARVGGDGAGAAIMAAVIAEIRRRPAVDVRQGWRAVALLRDTSGRVRGVLADGPGGLVEIVAPVTILATGGVGGLYAATTNPTSARGEGLAIAALAGAAIRDPEFVQFHPTAIDIAADPAPLATEALRGEGARLVGADGRPFMFGYHPAGDLAPRDVVARAIASERTARRGAFLDAREAIGAAFPEHFPAVFAACRAAGLDPREDLIPVRPAAHYHMGGIEADPDGRTSLPGLYAVGECAAVGVHGANRLASNSLLEAAVFGARAGRAAAAASDPGTRVLAGAAPAKLQTATLMELRTRMSAAAGVARNGGSLAELLGWIDRRVSSGPALPLLAARLIAAAALERRESRGAHYREDFPMSEAVPRHTRVAPSPADRSQMRRAA